MSVAISVVKSVVHGVVKTVGGSSGPDGVMLDAADNFMIFADGSNAAFS